MTLMPAAPARRLRLNDVTMCAVSSSNVEATIRALETSLVYIDVAEAIFFTDADLTEAGIFPSDRIRMVRIEKLSSAEAYSRFVISRLADYVHTSHCLIVQWDSHVIDPARWRSDFLDYDYIGASWPQFQDGHDVGNGGFSLRSRRLMDACRLPDFNPHHPEDVAICRTNRSLLDRLGLRFAPVELADAFSAERAGDPKESFGYHGVFLMPEVLGADHFWKIYETLDEYTSLRHDFSLLLASLRNGPRPFFRSLKMICDQFNWPKLYRS